MEKPRRACVKCGERYVRMREATNPMMTQTELRNIRAGRFGFCLTAICLACLGFLFVDDGKKIFTHGATTAGCITVILLLGWWLLLVFPLTRKEMHHYKCSKCGYTWDC